MSRNEEKTEVYLTISFLLYLCCQALFPFIYLLHSVSWRALHCYLPLTVPEYGRVILKSTVPRDTLLTLRHLQAICKLDDRLRSLPEFQPICETWSSGRCCPSWSLPNYVAFLSNRSSCHHIVVCCHCSPYCYLGLVCLCKAVLCHVLIYVSKKG